MKILRTSSPIKRYEPDNCGRGRGPRGWSVMSQQTGWRNGNRSNCENQLSASSISSFRDIPFNGRPSGRACLSVKNCKESPAKNGPATSITTYLPFYDYLPDKITTFELCELLGSRGCRYIGARKRMELGRDATFGEVQIEIITAASS